MAKLSKMNLKRAGKKAQIGSTLTWFVGFLVIFFILGLFLVATTLFSLKKKIISGSDEIELEKHLSNAKQQRVLFSLINSNINFSDNEVRIKDVLRDNSIYDIDESKKNELKEKIENKIKEILFEEFGENNCYIFEAKYGVKDDNLNFVEKGKLSFSNYNNQNIDARELRYINVKNNLLKNSIMIILVRDVNTNTIDVKGDYEKIIINFYGGKCL